MTVGAPVARVSTAACTGSADGLPFKVRASQSIKASVTGWVRCAAKSVSTFDKGRVRGSGASQKLQGKS